MQYSKLELDCIENLQRIYLRFIVSVDIHMTRTNFTLLPSEIIAPVQHTRICVSYHVPCHHINVQHSAKLLKTCVHWLERNSTLIKFNKHID